jgi:hypothetical protein
MSSPANSTLHNWRIRSAVNTKLNLLRAGAQAPAKLLALLKEIVPRVTRAGAA